MNKIANRQVICETLMEQVKEDVRPDVEVTADIPVSYTHLRAHET